MQSVWRPESEIEIVAGTPPGGGLDRTARALAGVIDASGLVDVPVRVRNVPGDGARKAWAYMDTRAGDPHVVSISHPNLTTDRLLGLARFDHGSYTPLAVLYTEYIAFVARHDAPLRAARDLLERARADASSLTVALSTALGNPNHIALARIVRHAGADPRAPRIRVFDSALDAVEDVVAGSSDLAAVTAASVSGAMAAGKARVLAVSAPRRLESPFDGIATWVEHGVDCSIGAWRGMAGARDISDAHVEFWQRMLRAATASAEWTRGLSRHGWTPSYVDGPALQDFLEQERHDMAASLAELGLIARET